MKTVKPKHRQSLADLALQTAGSVEAIVSLSLKNDLSLSDELEVEQLETVEPIDTTVFNRYSARNVHPATEITPEDIETVPFEGIGFMSIEVDFTVR